MVSAAPAATTVPVPIMKEPTSLTTEDFVISALAAARALEEPDASLTKGGEFEGHEFWEAHDSLLTDAWSEHGPKSLELYTYGSEYERMYFSADLRSAIHSARERSDESLAHDLFWEPVPGVFASDRLFTPRFSQDMLLELAHIEGSGIPKRRPNGMNRYGVILDQVGLESTFQSLSRAVIRPLAAMLFPESISRGDADEHYAFTIRYQPGGDTKLAKHSDASIATLALCLGEQNGTLRFFEQSPGLGIYALPRGTATPGGGDVEVHQGLALIHRGQHKHQAMQLLTGMRVSLIIWLFAEHGVVRIAPYPPNQQMTVAERWHQQGPSPRQTLEL